jgi:hypothetical protein
MTKIIEDIVRSERCLLNSALILYRDHPPQDSTFVTQVHDFTDDTDEAKKNIDAAYALGGLIVTFLLIFFLSKGFCLGGDLPEAIAPALHAAVHTLSWRANAVKIALLIADAPPHGLTTTCGDSWPNGTEKYYFQVLGNYFDIFFLVQVIHQDTIQWNPLVYLLNVVSRYIQLVVNQPLFPIAIFLWQLLLKPVVNTYHWLIRPI